MEILKVMFVECALILGIVFMISLIVAIVKAIFAPIAEKKARKEFEQFLLELMKEGALQDSEEETAEKETEETEEKEEE